MDAKSRANFINSVASGTVVLCPKCGTRNETDSKFCMSCGAEITATLAAASSTPAFEPVKESVTPAKKSVTPTKGNGVSDKVTKYVEPNNVFAQGLPEWNLEPPQVMVRRR